MLVALRLTYALNFQLCTKNTQNVLLFNNKIITLQPIILNLMKRILSLVLVLLSAIAMQAKVISVTEAQSLAKQKLVKAYQNLELAYTAIPDKPLTINRDFYVFNKSGNEGFVIVAADDVVEGAILGYSDSGSFEYDKLPENAKAWLKGYQDQIEYLRATGEKSILPKSAKAPVPVISPLLGEITWDQGDPFNRLCPTDGGGRCVTGCVATAMAMTMYYHKWPLVGTGSKSYKWNGQTLSADFSTSHYEWDKMMPQYHNFTAEQANAVAQLMYDCGISVSMQYSSGGSGTYTNYVASALKNYFGYKTSTKYVYRGAYSQTSWETMLKTELEAGRVIIYSGDNKTDGGHCFVTDGFDSNGYFHFNFGWSGIGNGYFTPAVAGSFTDNQEAIIGIAPNRPENIVDGLCYNILGDETAEVTFSTKSTYSGDIVIPSTVVLDEKEYRVTDIGPKAFEYTKITSLVIPETIERIAANSIINCSKLTSVTIEGNTPKDFLTTIFDNTAYDNATLHVPAGMFDAYKNAFPWSVFRKITDGNDSIEWSKWEPVKDGFGTYTYSYRDFYDPSVSPVASRYLLSDENAQQFKIDNFGTMSSLIVNHDSTTHNCTVPKQRLGTTYSGHVYYVADAPTFNKNNSYKNSPCTFDEEIGKLSLTLVYHYENLTIKRGVDEFLISGFPIYDITIDDVTVDEEGEMTGKLSFTDDVNKYAYVINVGTLTKTDAQIIADAIKAGTITPEYATEHELKVQLAEPDKYTLTVVSMTPEGQFREFAFFNFEYQSAKEPEWVAKYEGTYEYSVWEKITQNSVVAYQDKNNPKNWKLAPMYGDTEFFFYWDTEAGTVSFEEQKTAFVYKKVDVTVNDYRSVKAGSDASYYDAEKKTLFFDTYYLSGKFKEYGFETYTILKDLAPEGMAGDANNDGKVDVADITTIASFILGTTPEPFNKDNADVDGDGEITVSDITKTAAIILGK